MQGLAFPQCFFACSALDQRGLPEPSTKILVKPNMNPPIKLVERLQKCSSGQEHVHQIEGLAR
jgi:hypothetical protein